MVLLLYYRYEKHGKAGTEKTNQKNWAFFAYCFGAITCCCSFADLGKSADVGKHIGACGDAFDFIFFLSLGFLKN